MTLENTEKPIHVPTAEGNPSAVSCDYMDVSVVESGQPRIRLQPHAPGGEPIGVPLLMELEGVRGLIQHLDALIRHPEAD